MHPVEHLLNLLWLMIASTLFLQAARSHSRGQLRCSLPVALGCTALLALVLFPALSMTDDLQRAKLDVETSERHLGATLLLGSPDDRQLQTGSLAAALVLVLIAVARRKNPGVLPRFDAALPRVLTTSFRPEAVRPPPVLV